MPVSKKRKFTRKIEKRYEFVTFKTDVYEEDFTFPKLDMAPIRVIEAASAGNMNVLQSWLVEAGVDEESIEAFMELTMGEVEEFMGAWRSGQLASVPK